VSASRLHAIVLVAALGVLPVLPPEHVHELTDAEGHHTLVAHRHAQAHTAAMPRQGRDTIDHSDPIGVDLDGVYTSPDRYVLQAPFVGGPASLAPLTMRRVRRSAPRFSAQLIHAPPRAPSSLRAPPNLGLL
jgi:hypothetical protein